MRILLADDDLARIASLEVILGREGFNVYSTDDGDEVVELGKMYDYDLILLGDIAFAHRVLQQLRSAKVKTPILRLSTLTMPQDAVVALNAGADDYVSSPPHTEELIARIHAIVRRSKGHAQSLVTVGALTINLGSKTVSLAGQHVHLTGKEYAMLELLGLRKGSLITKDMFLNHLYGGMDEPEIKIIDVFICKLRRKLANVSADGLPSLIETVWGRGYVLRESEIESPSLAPEVRDMMDAPPVHVSMRTAMEANGVGAKKRFGSPSIVPEAGQK